VRFVVREGAPVLVDGAHIGDLVVGEDAFFVRDRYLPVAVHPGFERTVVDIWPTPGVWRNPALGALVQPADRAFNDAWRRLAKRFFYHVFDQALQLHQLAHGQTWCHASGFTRDGRGVLLMAWGGVGKTSSVIQFLNAGGAQFISDDLAVVDDTGTMYRTPQRMQIYPYNLEGEPELRARLLAGRGAIDRANWFGRSAAFGKKSVRRRVHPEELFGADSVADRAPVTDALFLRRVSGGEFRTIESPAAEVARMSGNVLQRELTPLDDIFAAVASSGLFRPQPARIVDQTGATAAATSILERAFTMAGARTAIVDVPLHATPADLRRYLSSDLEAPVTVSGRRPAS
jgi:hypothetical protein